MPTVKSRQPVLSRGMYLPPGSFTEEMRKELTVRKYVARGDIKLANGYNEETKQHYIEVRGYTENENGWTLVPRQYGLKKFQSYKDNTSAGVRVKWGKAVPPRSEEQAEFIDSIEELSKKEYDIVVKAHTGSGKSYSSMEVARRRGLATIVLVDQKNLLEQWVGVCKNLFGLSDEQIGIVQGPNCDYKGKVVVIGMMQSLWQRTYEKELYDYFGTVIIDEVHVSPAPKFSRVMLLFSAKVRIGLSATPDRGDALDAVRKWNLGDVKVQLNAKHEASVVYYRTTQFVASWYANMASVAGRFESEVAYDGKRNLLVLDSILYLYREGHPTIVFSDRIEHLESLAAMLYFSGIPEKDFGIYTGKRYKWVWKKEVTPARRPKEWDREFPYTHVKYGSKSYTPKQAELKEIKENKKIILAIYAAFSKGVDEPRLSGGIDATPRSRAQQVHGRILRQHTGKKSPVWITFRDPLSSRAEFLFANRLLEYTKSNAKVYEWDARGNLNPVDIRRLRGEVLENVNDLQSRIHTTDSGGRNIVLTQYRETKPNPTRKHSIGKIERYQKG